MGADKKIEAAKNEYKHHTRLQFPSDLGAYAMVFNFINYEYKPSGFGLVTPKSNPVTAETIVLPLPQNLEDIVSVKSSSADLGITGAAAYGIMNMSAESAAATGSAAMTSAMGLIGDPSALTDVDTYLSSLRAFSQFAGRAALDSILPGAGLAADLTTGTAVNPHTTLDFDGVALKNHNFQWTLSPRNERESTSLNNIVKTIKRNMLPQYQGLGGGTIVPRALLTYPKLVKISLLGINQDYFYYYKPSMINGLNVQYTQGNGVSLLKGGRPAVVTISLSLLEAEIHTAGDYGNTEQGGQI